MVDHEIVFHMWNTNHSRRVVLQLWLHRKINCHKDRVKRLMQFGRDNWYANWLIRTLKVTDSMDDRLRNRARETVIWKWKQSLTYLYLESWECLIFSFIGLLELIPADLLDDHHHHLRDTLIKLGVLVNARNKRIGAFPPNVGKCNTIASRSRIELYGWLCLGPFGFWNESFPFYNRFPLDHGWLLFFVKDAH